MENKKIILFDDFNDSKLNENYWLPVYLPQWSSKEKSAPSYQINDSVLSLYIANDQMPWCEEFNGNVRVSNLQTGVYSGEVGSNVGQHQFTEKLVVKEQQEKDFRAVFQYGSIEFKAKCKISKENVAALWMIGVEEEKRQSAEICLFELKGWNVQKEKSVIGYGVHPFADDKITDEFYEEEFSVDVSQWNTYSLDWDESKITFYINGEVIRTINQSPDYPVQIMLNLYDLENVKNEENCFDIDYVKVTR